MIYTSYDMIRDCRADRAQGWSYFISNYVPVIRRLLAHYDPGGRGDDRILRGVLMALRKPESNLFRSMEEVPERWFLAELRQKVLDELKSPPAGIEIDLETVAAALAPLTLAEKQAAWLETMRYDLDQTGSLLQMDPRTVQKIRGKAADLIRGRQDAWCATLLAENGRALGRAAVDLANGECLSPKIFLDVLDGRMTWQGRDRMERHVANCWHCIDHFCRLVEVVELLRGSRPLEETEAEPYRSLLGVESQTQWGWKRLFGG